MTDKAAQVGTFVRDAFHRELIMVDLEDNGPRKWAYGHGYTGRRHIVIDWQPVSDPAQYLLRHCLADQAQIIVKSNIWPDLADQIRELARTGPAQAYLLGFGRAYGEAES